MPILNQVERPIQESTHTCRVHSELKIQYEHSISPFFSVITCITMHSCSKAMNTCSNKIYLFANNTWLGFSKDIYFCYYNDHVSWGTNNTNNKRLFNNSNITIQFFIYLKKYSTVLYYVTFLLFKLLNFSIKHV